MTAPLPYELSGNKSSKQLLVFLHGWPDTTAVWDKVIPDLESDYYIINVSYPNYSPKEKLPWGLPFEALVERLKVTIDQVNDTKRKIVVVSHDWGAIFGYHLDQMYPSYVSEMMPLDVGPKFNFLHPFVALYQFILIFLFFIGGPIARIVTQGALKLVKYRPPWLNRIDGSFHYPYYYLWEKIVKARFNVDKAILPNYIPSCNVAFTWGAKNPMKFHLPNWINTLNKNPRNEIHSVQTEHWIQQEQPQFIISLIRRRVKLMEENSTPSN